MSNVPDRTSGAAPAGLTEPGGDAAGDVAIARGGLERGGSVSMRRRRAATACRGGVSAVMTAVAVATTPCSASHGMARSTPYRCSTATKSGSPHHAANRRIWRHVATTCSESSPSARIRSRANSTARSDVWATGRCVASSSRACSIRLTVAQPRTCGSDWMRSNPAAALASPARSASTGAPRTACMMSTWPAIQCIVTLRLARPSDVDEQRTDRREVQVECVLELAHAPAARVRRCRSAVTSGARLSQYATSAMRFAAAARSPSHSAAYSAGRRKPFAGGDHRLDERVEAPRASARRSRRAARGRCRGAVPCARRPTWRPAPAGRARCRGPRRDCQYAELLELLVEIGRQRLVDDDARPGVLVAELGGQLAADVGDRHQRVFAARVVRR